MKQRLRLVRRRRQRRRKNAHLLLLAFLESVAARGGSICAAAKVHLFLPAQRLRSVTSKIIIDAIGIYKVT